MAGSILTYQLALALWPHVRSIRLIHSKDNRICQKKTMPENLEVVGISANLGVSRLLLTRSTSNGISHSRLTISGSA